MAGLIEKSVLLGLGVLTLTLDKVVQVVNKLVEEGEVEAEEAPTIVDKLVARGEREREEIRRLVRQELDKVHARAPVASRQEIEELNQKIDALIAQVQELAAR